MRELPCRLSIYLDAAPVPKEPELKERWKKKHPPSIETRAPGRKASPLIVLPSRQIWHPSSAPFVTEPQRFRLGKVFPDCVTPAKASETNFF